MMQDQSNLLQSGKPDLWPHEFWQLIHQLAERAQVTSQPRISLTNSNCPKYVSPVSDIHYEFNLALVTLEGLGIIEIRWLAEPGSQAAWVRLQLGKEENLKNIIKNYSPLQVQQKVKSQDFDWGFVESAYQRYGRLGLRTMAHIAFGASHSLDTISIPPEFENKIWLQPDAISIGSDLIRVGGLLEFTSPSGKFTERWSRPGHYIWDWDIAELQIGAIGQKLLLVENPYPYWELFARLKDQSVSLICIHGETRHHHAQQSALGKILGYIYQKYPNLDTYIWCDPDPGGVFIASNAARLVQKMGGRSQFFKMDPGVFDRLEEVLLSKKSTRPISQPEKDWLQSTEIHPDLLPLAKFMFADGLKEEQEGLAVTISIGDLEF